MLHGLVASDSRNQFLIKGSLRTGKIAQWEEGLAIKPVGLSEISGIHIVEGQKRLL